MSEQKESPNNSSSKTNNSLKNVLVFIGFIFLGLLFFGYDDCKSGFKRVFKKGVRGFAGCKSANIVDTSMQLKEGQYYSILFEIPASECKIKVELFSSSEEVGIYLMHQKNLKQFQKATKGGGDIKFISNFSKNLTKSYSKTGKLPEGKYAFVVYLKRTSLIFKDETKINIKVDILE
jgi:hypothetical protein